MDVRERLARRLGSGAAWRTAQSAEHPEDDGNRRSADALTELAGHVMTLPLDDSRLNAIAELSFGERVFSGVGDEVDQLIVRYGSNRHLQPDPASFLRELVGIADRNAQESRRARRLAASAKAQAALADSPDVPDASERLGDRIASDSDLPGASTDFVDEYGPPSKWEFRPPHPMGDATITEMALDGTHERAKAATPSGGRRQADTVV